MRVKLKVNSRAAIDSWLLKWGGSHGTPVPIR
jgi:hypothetical protein